MTVDEMQKLTGKSKRLAQYILRGKPVSRKLAKHLETATGVTRLAWLYPGEYPNPLVKTNGSPLVVS
jgi:hypothetical protein